MGCLSLGIEVRSTGLCVAASVLAGSLLVCTDVKALSLTVCTDVKDGLTVCTDTKNTGLDVSVAIICESDLGVGYYLYVEEGRVVIEEGYAKVFENVY